MGMNRLTLSALAFLSCSPLLFSQPATQPETWTVKVYRYPGDALIGGFVSSEHGQLTPPALPAANAKEEDILAFLKRSHFVVGQHMIAAGITLPPGSLAAFDPQNKTLALRSTSLAHERVTALAAQMERNMPRQVSFNVQIIEADGATVREAVKSIAALADHATAFTLLDGLVSQGKANYVGSLQAETKSGTRATVSRGEGRLYISEMEVDEAGRATTVMEERRAGTLFEMEPTVGIDGETLDLTFSLEHHHGPPVEHWDKVNVSGDRIVEMPNVDFHTSKVNTGFTLLSGMTKLVGIWRPEGTGKQPERADHLQAAFVQPHIVTLLPALNPRVEQWLKQHGEKVEKTPTAPPAEIPGAPKGIIVRSFHISEEMMTMGDRATGSPVEPFGAPAAAAGAAAPMANEARLTVQMTAVDILKSRGIPFPEGSSASYTPATGELLVRNTEANMKLIVEFISSLRKYSPSNVSMTLHIVEAPAAVIRKLQRESMRISDHTAAWRSMEQEVAQNKARILHTAFLETKSGYRSSFTTSREFLYSTSGTALSTDSRTQNAAPKDNKGSITNVQISTTASPGYSASMEMRPVGLSFEVDPTLGADGETLDLTYQLKHDYAAPTLIESIPAAGGKTLRPMNRNIQFHQAELVTGTTFISGTSRLLGIWKPEGTPELDAADVLQAAFLTVEVVPVIREVKP